MKGNGMKKNELDGKDYWKSDGKGIGWERGDEKGNSSRESILYTQS